jgi:hypothetical protein
VEVTIDHGDSNEPNKVLKEFGTAISMTQDTPGPVPQDLIDTFIMPGLRRSYDKARHDDWRLAKATTSEFEFRLGPVWPIWEHTNGEPCETMFDDEAECQWCGASIPQEVIGYNHQFGWYVAIEVEEEDVPYAEDPQVKQKSAITKEIK